MARHPIYVVLELPEPVATAVLAIRRRYDQRLAGFPAEITVAGSSGVGPLRAEQAVEPVLECLQHIADTCLPIRLRFAGLRRFASGPVTWLAPADPAPLLALHQRLAGSGFAFAPHRFEFTPHCSVCSTALDPAQQAQLLAEPVPAGTFELSRLALYALVDGSPQLLHRVERRQAH